MSDHQAWTVQQEGLLASENLGINDEQTVENSIRAWKILGAHRDRVKFYLLIDEPLTKFKHLPDFVNVINVPQEFVAGNARYKARALEYFRKHQSLTKKDWVLHLDEECIINDHVIDTCVDFIERGSDDIGMVSTGSCPVCIKCHQKHESNLTTILKGTIHYNTVNHWTQPLLSAAEVCRIAEDFGKFQLPVRYIRRPLLGWMHGSWVLINGDVENKITWATDCVAEDFWFALNVSASPTCSYKEEPRYLRG